MSWVPAFDTSHLSDDSEKADLPARWHVQFRKMRYTNGKAELQGVDADTAVVMVVECPEEVVVIVDSVEGCTPDRMFVGEATEEGFGITTV